MLPPAVIARHFAFVTQSLHSRHQLDEHTKLRHSAGFPANDITHSMGPEECLPSIGLQLFNAQGKASGGSVYIQYDRLDHLTFLHQFRWMLYPYCPGHVGNMHEAIYTFFDLDERSEI